MRGWRRWHPLSSLIVEVFRRYGGQIMCFFELTLSFVPVNAFYSKICIWRALTKTFCVPIIFKFREFQPKQLLILIFQNITRNVSIDVPRNQSVWNTVTSFLSVSHPPSATFFQFDRSQRLRNTKLLQIDSNLRLCPHTSIYSLGWLMATYSPHDHDHRALTFSSQSTPTRNWFRFKLRIQ